MALSALAAPIGINPKLVAHKTETLTIKSNALSFSWDVTLADGSVLLTVEGEGMSLSHRKAVLDLRRNLLFEVRKETWTASSAYYGQTSDDGPALWTLESHFGFSGSKNEMKFNNMANDGGEVMLEFKNDAFGGLTEVRCGGQTCALIDRKMISLTPTYEAIVAAGMDMSIITGLVLVLADKARNRRRRAA